MIDFLSSHARYATMNSWNDSFSYANCVKLYKLGLTPTQLEKAYSFLEMPELGDSAQSVIDDFTEEQGGAYTIGFNGRSRGYLVLYHSKLEDTGYRSRCRQCGQMNYRSVYQGPRDGNEGVVAKSLMDSKCSWTAQTYCTQPDVAALGLPDERIVEMVNRLRPMCANSTLSNECGRCHASGDAGRINLTKPVTRLAVLPGKSLDSDIEWDEVETEALRARVKLVLAFDNACDAIRESLINLIETHEVVETTVMVPKQVKVLSPIAEQ